MHHKRLMIEFTTQQGSPRRIRSLADETLTPLESSYASLIHRKRLTMDNWSNGFSGELQPFAFARWPRFASIRDLGARPPSQASLHPAVKFALGGSPPFAIVELMHHKPLTMHAGFAIKKVSPVSDRAVATACPL